MKRIYPLLYVLTGLTFLLIATVFYAPISQTLTRLQGQTDIPSPDFWSLPVVLKVVRVIFLLVGAFLTSFGVGMLWLKKQWPW